MQNVFGSVFKQCYTLYHVIQNFIGKRSVYSLVATVLAYDMIFIENKKQCKILAELHIKYTLLRYGK